MTPDKLDELRAMAMRLRDLTLTKRDLEDRLKQANMDINDLQFKIVPDFMGENGITEIALEAEGNLPAMEIKSEPYYRANIASSWPEDKRQEAFKWLTDHGFGDLIKTEVTCQFARGKREDALRFAKEAERYGAAADVEETVPWSTLTAWLREQWEKYRNMPPLDVIGGTVGRIAKIKEKRDA